MMSIDMWSGAIFAFMIWTQLWKLRLCMHTGRLWLDLFQNYRQIAFAKIWHFFALVALKDTKKPMKYWKRPTMAVNVTSKARELKNGKTLIFIASLCSFGVKNEEDLVFWCFKVIKAKKATLVARKAKLQRSNAKDLWLVLYCRYGIIVLP